LAQVGAISRNELTEVVVCLFHGDSGSADPGFSVVGASAATRGWRVAASQLTQARNLGEAQAIQRRLLRGEAVSWCHPGYSWVDQPAIGWFYIAAFLFVVLPYLFIRIRERSAGFRRNRTPRQRAEDVSRLRA
jgi:hypothetical protein